MQFIFHFSNNKDAISQTQLLAESSFENNKIIKIENCILCYEHILNENNILQQPEFISYIIGYIRNFKIDKESTEYYHNISLIDEVINGFWPVNENFTGSFSFIIFHKYKKELIIANDLIGLYPIYYYISKTEIIISSLLNLLGIRINGKIDPTGLIQTISGPDYCNFGKRTLIKNIHRLLPGECLYIKPDNLSDINRKYDYTLYQNILEYNSKSTLQDVVDLLRKELEIAVRFENEIHLALSGGLDSRIILANLPDNKALNCITYGNINEYEVKIARKCCEVRDNTYFTQFPVNPEHIFPKYSELMFFIKKTEAVGINNWFAIDKNFKNKIRLLLVGEMTEALMGRNIYPQKGISLYDLIRIGINRKLEINIDKGLSMDLWKRRKVNTVLSRAIAHNDNNIPKIEINKFIKEINLETDYETLMNEWEGDIRELLDLIELHNIEQYCLMDELFAWYTHARIPMGKQILLNNYQYRTISPTMSINFLRKVSAIHPSRRVFSQLMHQIFRYDDRLKKYGVVPIASSPFIPYRFPFIVVLIMNGLRYKIDQYLMKRVLRKNNPYLRARLCNTINWAQLYSDPMVNNINIWFSHNNLGSYGEEVLKIVNSRRFLNSWPLSTFDITSIGAINALISEITKGNK